MCNCVLVANKSAAGQLAVTTDQAEFLPGVGIASIQNCLHTSYDIYMLTMEYIDFAVKVLLILVGADQTMQSWRKEWLLDALCSLAGRLQYRHKLGFQGQMWLLKDCQTQKASLGKAATACVPLPWVCAGSGRFWVQYANPAQTARTKYLSCKAGKAEHTVTRALPLCLAVEHRMRCIAITFVLLRRH